MKRETAIAVQIMRELLEQSANQEQILNLTVIDVDDHPERAAEYNVRSVPCLLIETAAKRREFAGDLSDCRTMIRELVVQSGCQKRV